MTEARKRLQQRFNKSKTLRSPQSSQLLDETPEEEKVNTTPTKVSRQWVTINNKVDAKAMQRVNVNEDDSATQINLEAEMEKYLGGDDEILEGFYDSDDEIPVFDSINPDSQATGAKQGFFGRITSAFQSIAGNKVLTREDIQPILVKFAQTLMDKNVN